MKLRLAYATLIALCVAPVLEMGCKESNMPTREQVQDGLSTAQTLCVLANAFVSNEALGVICKIPDALLPSAQRIRDEHKSGMEKAAASARAEERKAASAPCAPASK